MLPVTLQCIFSMNATCDNNDNSKMGWYVVDYTNTCGPEVDAYSHMIETCTTLYYVLHSQWPGQQWPLMDERCGRPIKHFCVGSMSTWRQTFVIRASMYFVRATMFKGVMITMVAPLPIWQYWSAHTSFTDQSGPVHSRWRDKPWQYTGSLTSNCPPQSASLCAVHRRWLFPEMELARGTKYRYT